MAIKPSPGHYTKEEVQIQIDQVKADIQIIESKLAQMRDYPQTAGGKPGDAERPDNTLPGAPDKPSAKPPFGDKPGPGRR